MKGENKENNVGSAGRMNLAGKSIPTLPLILMLLLIGVAGALVLIKDRPGAAEPDPTLDPDNHFSSCKLLAANCIDEVSCDLSLFCGDGLFQDCRVYDCGDNYGVFTKDNAGNVNFKNEAKADETAVAPVRDACSGTMEILSQECVADKTEIKLQLHTKGTCEIEDFATIYEEIGVQPSTFVSVGDGVYTITSFACGKISRIVPAAASGIGLELPMTGA